MDLDQSGFGFQRVRTYLGPTLGWKDELVQPTVEITTSGTYVVKPGDSVILVDVAAAVSINLPDVTKWVQQNQDQPATGFERSITIKDLGGNAANFNIVVNPFGAQAIDNIQGSLVISTARAAAKLIPLIDMSGWAVALASATGGGGGGGGDVFKAGNNTFTGVNTFQGQITVPTVALVDNSDNAASTAWVNSHNYITSVALGPYALIASPTFTGDPRAPTPAPGDNDTSLATTEFVQAAIAAGGAAAPVGAEYITASINATLTAERVLTNTASITWDFSTPGQAKASTSAGGGNVSNSGTPVNGQLAVWVTATTIQGVNGSTLFAPIASPVFTGDPQAPTPISTDNDTSIATTAFVQTGLATKQPADADLTALSALTGTNTIYYRSAPDIWSPVTFSGLTFSGGVLTSAGGGNVSNSGSPTAGQIALWVDATHIQGVATATLGFAPIANPVFTGDPQAPTPATADNDTSIATTAYVKNQGYLTTASAATVYAPIANPVFTGDPKAPTPLTADNDTSIATTAYVKAQGYLVSTDLSPYALIASPTFTGDPKAPTATPGDNDTSIATTAFVTAAVAAATGATSPPTPPQGRLTLSATVPVPLSPINGSTSIYYIPFVGNYIPIFDGTKFVMTAFGSLIANTADTSKNPAAIGANRINDWFVWNDAGTIRLGHGPDWLTDTTRAVGHTPQMVQGIWTNNVAITNGPGINRGTYVGTTVSNATSTLDWQLGSAGAGGVPARLVVWNTYNRVDVGTKVADTTVSWTYNVAAFRYVNGSTNNAIYFVQGLAEEAISASYGCMGVAGSAGDNVVGIALDVLQSLSTGYFSTGGTSSTPTAHWSGYCTAVGYHVLFPIERQISTASVMTNFGSNSGEQVMNFSARFRM